MNFINVKLKTLLVCLVLSFVSLSASAKDIFYVKSGGTGDGSSWSKAMGNIQQAVDSAAKSRADVWVAKGVYYGDSTSAAVVNLSPGVNLYGGFAGNESSLSDRDLEMNVTVIDGELNKKCILQESGFDDSLAVIVDGFSLEKGRAGFWDDGGCATVAKNVTFINCVIKNNSGSFNTAFVVRNSVIKKCKFLDNSANIISASYCVVDSCIFNAPTSREIGIATLEQSKLTNCLFYDNAASYGLINATKNSFVSNCEIYRNKTLYDPLVNLNNSSMVNCLIYENVADRSNTIVMVRNSSSFSNSTVANNTTTSISTITGTIANDSYSSVVSNSIIFGNKMSNELKPQINKLDFMKVRYCASDEELDGDNCIKLAKANSGSDSTLNYVCFVNAVAGDYRLHATSSCIDKGLDSLCTQNIDVYGKARIYGKSIDLGAIEFDGEYVPMLDYNQTVCYNGNTIEATFDSTISKIDWQIVDKGNVSGFTKTSGSGVSIPSMQLKTSKNDIDILSLKVIPYDSGGVAGVPFSYNYYVYPDLSKQTITFKNPKSSYEVLDKSNDLTIIWSSPTIPVVVEHSDLYVWKSSEEMPKTPIASLVKGNSRYISKLDNHTTYLYMVKIMTSCNTISTDVDSFRIDIPEHLTIVGSRVCELESKLNDTTSITRNIKGFELKDSISYFITGVDSSDFSVKLSDKWNPLTGGNFEVYFTPTDSDKPLSKATLTFTSDKHSDNIDLSGVLANYHSFDVLIDKKEYKSGDTIAIKGHVSDAFGNPLAGKQVKIYMIKNGLYIKSFDLVSDAKGEVEAKYISYTYESGVYSVGMCMNGESSKATYAEFNIPGISCVVDNTNWQVQRGDTILGSVTIKNNSNIAVHSLKVKTLTLANGCKVEFDTIGVLNGIESKKIKYNVVGMTLTEGNDHLPSSFRVETKEGLTSDFFTYFYCEMPYGQIKVLPSNINEYVSKQNPKYIDLLLINEGQGETGKVTIAIPKFDGITMPTGTVIDNIKSGDTVNMTLKLAYYDGAPLNTPVNGNIAVKCENGKSTSIAFNMEYTSENVGNVVVDVVDEYFYNSTSKKHLEGASVEIKNAFNSQIIASAITDSTGKVSFDSIPEGDYLLTIKADKHSDYKETITVQAGQTLDKFAFVSYQAVTYTWNVVRTEVEDKYEMTLNTEFETNVPVPVVAIKFIDKIPAKESFEINVPQTFMLSVVNYGLIAAKDVKIGINKCPGFRFYAPYNHIDSLPANYAEFIPITIVRTEANLDNSNNVGGVLDSFENDYYDEYDMVSLESQYYFSPCANIFADYVYVCKHLIHRVVYSENWWRCEAEPFDVNINGEWLANIHGKSVSMDLPCNSCWYSHLFDPLECIGDLFGKLGPFGKVVEYGIDMFDELVIKKGMDEFDKEFYDGIADLDEETIQEDPQWYNSLVNGDVEAAINNIKNEDVALFGKVTLNTLTSNSSELGKLDIVHKGHNVLKSFKNKGTSDFFRESLPFVFETFRSITTEAVPEVDVVPWSCADLICEISSCAIKNKVMNCDEFTIGSTPDEADEDNHRYLTKSGDTVIIENGKIVEVLYANGDNVINSEDQKNIFQIEKAMSEMTNSIFQISDSKLLSVHDVLELSSFVKYCGDIIREFTGSSDALSMDGIVEYFHKTIKYYSRRRKIDFDAVKNLSTSNLSVSEIMRIANRWNYTLDARANGVYLPNEQYPDMVDISTIETYLDSVANFVTYMNLRGFGTPFDMFSSVNKALNQPKQNSVCASVKMQISQSMVLTREAFDGTLVVKNANENGAMGNFKVVLEIRNEKGELVNDLFQINTENLVGITAVDGSDEIASMTEATAMFRFIPEKGAAPMSPTNYSFGGYLVYVDHSSGDTIKSVLYPVTLTVNPSPDLQIDYFMQRNVLGDDALTLDRVEPTVPAALGVIINNQGYGVAKNVKLESAKPEIVDNEKGLLIDFDFIGASLNGKDCNLGYENINFGNIDAQSSKTGLWWLTSSLLGHFTKYEANVVHSNSFGNSELSLINGVSIHELIKTVDAYGTMEDDVVDFLVNDDDDSFEYPDAIYYSNGGKDTVKMTKSAKLDKTSVTLSDTIVTLSVTPADSGWTYAQLADPGNNNYDIKKIVRVKDNVELPLSNVWTTFVTLPDGEEPIYENRLHFLDYMSTLEESDYKIYYSIKKNILNVTEISGVPENESTVTSPVDSVVVKFNTAIQIQSFDYNDIELYCQAGDNLSDSTITIKQIDELTYMVNISAKTKTSGFYKLEVNVDNIYDKNGYSGVFGKSAAWTQLIVGESGDEETGDGTGEGDIITTLTEVDIDDIVVYAYQNSIYVKSAKSGSIDIYDVLSKLVVKNAKFGEGVSKVATLPKGVYIIEGNKVILR